MATTYYVTNNNDSGTGSLRAAMTSAFTSSGNTIMINSGLVITPLSSLPQIPSGYSITMQNTGGITSGYALASIVGPLANISAATTSIGNITLSGLCFSSISGGVLNPPIGCGVITVTNCWFNNCGGTFYQGGGSALSAAFTNCTFVGCSGAIRINGPATYTNCTFVNCSSGGWLLYCTTNTCINCTFTGNNNLYYDVFPATAITNCIFWQETNGNGLFYGSPTVTYSNVQGGYAGTGNINSNPQFYGPNQPWIPPTAEASYMPVMILGPSSPCLYTGTSSGAPTTDENGFAWGYTTLNWSTGTWSSASNPCMGSSGVAAIQSFYYYQSVQLDLQAIPVANNEIQLTWNAGWSSWNLYRGTSSGGETLLASNVGTPNANGFGLTYLDTGLTTGTTYYYYVVSSASTQWRSLEASATAVVTIPVVAQSVLSEPHIPLTVKPNSAKPQPHYAMSTPIAPLAHNAPVEVGSPTTIGRGIRQGVYLPGQ